MMSRRTFSKFALATSLTLALVPFAAQAVATIDQAAPAFTAKGADGSAISLSAYKGKTVVLEWTNHDCPFVKKHYESGNIPKLQQEATAKGVIWLQVISSAPGEQGQVDGPTAIKINGYRGAKPTNTVLDPDGSLGKLYGAKTTPHLFIIDPQGKLVYKGGIDSIASTNPADIGKAENYVSSALTAVAAGKKVANPSTQPYGCSVKYAS
jgi:peroxiredoxin